jgi:hypothetical protein
MVHLISRRVGCNPLPFVIVKAHRTVERYFSCPILSGVRLEIEEGVGRQVWGIVSVGGWFDNARVLGVRGHAEGGYLAKSPTRLTPSPFQNA